MVWGKAGRAWLTVPPEVEVTASSIPHAGLGVDARTFIHKYTWLGEFEGEIIMDPTDLITEYAWTVSRHHACRLYGVKVMYIKFQICSKYSLVQENKGTQANRHRMSAVTRNNAVFLG